MNEDIRLLVREALALLLSSRGDLPTEALAARALLARALDQDIEHRVGRIERELSREHRARPQ